MDFLDFQESQTPAASWIIPSKDEHKRTFILLHGRGDRADSFGAGLLSTYLPDDTTFRSIYRDAKFVFLQAPLRELASWPGTKWYQWFDVWSLKPGSEETDLQIPGLRETVHLVHGALREEIELVGPENVVLGGLSQGCASSLISTLLWDGPPFAAYVGMCGWMPFRKLMETAIATEEAATSRTKETAATAPVCASISALAKTLGYAETCSASLVFQKIPFFLGHGAEDNVVDPRLGREAGICLDNLQAKAFYKEYANLAHWYGLLMLQDVVQFLNKETTWSTV